MVTANSARRARLAAGLLLIAMVTASCGGETTQGEIGTEPTAADSESATSDAPATPTPEPTRSPTPTLGATTFEGGPCTAGEHFIIWLEPAATADRFDAVESDLLADPQVMRVIYFDQGDAFREYQDLFADDPEALAEVPGPEVLPASYRVVVAATVVDASAVGEQFVGRPGVREVRICTDAEVARAELVDELVILDEGLAELIELFEVDQGYRDALAEAFDARAFVLAELGRFEQSLEDASAAIDLGPADRILASSYINRARAHANLDRLEEAVVDVTAAIDFAADSPDALVAAYLNRSGVFLEMERFEDAIEDATVGIGLGPTDTDTLARLHRNRASAYAALGSATEAIADYERLVELLPVDHPEGLNAMEQLAILRGASEGGS